MAMMMFPQQAQMMMTGGMKMNNRNELHNFNPIKPTSLMKTNMANNPFMMVPNSFPSFPFPAFAPSQDQFRVASTSDGSNIRVGRDHSHRISHHMMAGRPAAPQLFESIQNSVQSALHVDR
jgi:hypothetical protein